jgi:hypothetical protein
VQVRQLCYKNTYFVEIFRCVLESMLLGREVCLSDFSFQCQEIPDASFLYTVSVSHVMAALLFRNDTEVVAVAQNWVPL